MWIFAQAFWWALQFAVALACGTALAYLIFALGYEPSRDSAAQFFVICFGVSFALFAAPATFALSLWLDRRRERKALEAADIEAAIAKTLHDRLSRGAASNRRLGFLKRLARHRSKS